MATQEYIDDLIIIIETAEDAGSVTNQMVAAVLDFLNVNLKKVSPVSYTHLTSYTAAQLTELQIELAKLGFFKEDIKAMTPSVLKFAKAVDTDLASAATLAGAKMCIRDRPFPCISNRRSLTGTARKHV